MYDPELYDEIEATEAELDHARHALIALAAYVFAGLASIGWLILALSAVLS